MADIFTSVKRSAVMSRIRSHGNKSTEAALAKLFRLHNVKGWRRQIEVKINKTETKEFKVKPDFVFPKIKLAVFVDGCFWHSCPKHGTRPKENRSFWRRKFFRNIKRDLLVTRTLRMHGWRVIRVWECSLKKNPLNCLLRIQRFFQFNHSPSR